MQGSSYDSDVSSNYFKTFPRGNNTFSLTSPGWLLQHSVYPDERQRSLGASASAGSTTDAENSPSLYGVHQRRPSMTLEDALPIGTVRPWFSSSPLSPCATYSEPQQASPLTPADLGHDQTKRGLLIKSSALRSGAEQELTSGLSSFPPASSPPSPSYMASLLMPEPPISINDAGLTAAQKVKGNANRIWSTSTTEERERVKDFWLGLEEQERRDLAKIEKDTVLKKMDMQQKHSCSCHVCRRKLTAIEEELEVLYDGYCEELEQYANYERRYISSGGTIPPPPGPGPFPGSVELDKDGAVVLPSTNHKQTRVTKHAQQLLQPGPPSQTFLLPITNGKDAFSEDEQEEDEYEYADGDDEDDQEEEEGKGRDGPFNIGRSLIVSLNLEVSGLGKILTVADDLLKNNGQKFLEMMKELAEGRIQYEEDAAADVEDESEDESESGGSDDDSENGDDSGSEGEDEDEDDEEEMTEEQKVEEGKRMFFIFAGLMFEQRVLQAYRENVVQERQLQLLRELEEEVKKKYVTEPAHDDHPPAPTSTSGQDDHEAFTREGAPSDLVDLDDLYPSTARSPRRSDPNLKPPPWAGRDSRSSAGMFTNAHINELNGGTFQLNNVAHIYECNSPAQGGGTALQIAVLGLQAVSVATHYSHCNYPLAPPPVIASPSTVYVALHFPSLYREMKIMIAPFSLWLFVKMWIQRRAIEYH